MHIKKGDTVKILSGKDRNRTGKVMAIDSKKLSAVVEGLNFFKKHSKPKKQGEKGEIIQVARPIPISKIMLVCPGCGKPSRVGFKTGEKTKERVCKKCGSAHA